MKKIMYSLERIVLILCFLAFVSSCQEQEKEILENPKDSQTGLALNQPYEYVKVIQPENYELLVRIDKNSLTFKKHKTTLPYKVGNILVSNIAPLAPYGYMREIVSIREEGNNFVYQTENATLDQIFENAYIHETKEFETNSYGNVANKVEVDGYHFLRFNKQFQNGISIRGEANVKPSFEFIWDMQGGTVRRTRLYLRGDLKDVELKGKYGVEREGSFETTLAEVQLPAISFFVGIIPIVFKNKFKVDIESNYSANMELNVGMACNTGDFGAGLDYNNGSWSNLGYSNINFKAYRPEFIVGGQTEVSAPYFKLESNPYGLKLFTFYGTARLKNTFNYNDYILNIQTTPSIQAGVKTAFFGFNEDYNFAYDFPAYTFYNGSLGGLPAWNGTFVGVPTPRSASITDIANHWAYNEIAYLIDNEYLSGYPNNTFRPNNYIRRAEFAAMIYSIIQPSIQPQFANRNFSDISGHWAEAKILHVARSGMMAGYPDGTFKPDSPISRAEMFAALSSLTPGNRDLNRLSYFVDNSSIAPWAKNAVATCHENEFIINYPQKNKLNSTQNASRAEAAATFYRVLAWRGNLINPFENPYLVK
ncbi:S-layer homology domain-containing protein [Bernardetia sp. OM2101]|uniref:S-layer homology domain-containing protein n=1 Tax=Bernardetia sp. OM2101 TaxID=3344876 RepID=UPI0035CE9030